MAGSISHINHHQKQNNHAQPGESNFGIVPHPVIALHGVEQYQEGAHRPAQLSDDKVRGVHVELEFRDDRRRAIDHHETEADKHGDGQKQNPVGLKTLSHRIYFKTILPLNV